MFSIDLEVPFCLVNYLNELGITVYATQLPNAGTSSGSPGLPTSSV